MITAGAYKGVRHLGHFSIVQFDVWYIMSQYGGINFVLRNI